MEAIRLRLCVTCTDEEFERVKQRAVTAKMSTSAFVRRMALEGEIPEDRLVHALETNTRAMEAVLSRLEEL